ncbi:ABC transporter ATP-binding protein [Acidipropionibacterium jensenii]|uniref:ABC transporter ATP-binding protein n=1 Tax=Acidipropionibacterium jensenii TaxID=1749 RepID=A0A3T0RYN8_9ACTN|nr:ABC transporter ATP-binding protein [Acidipropionibacterium jensenii]AZZ39225.1 ABC transporter ATP-binding protein [Acidipropionibacterium jensenii]
MIEFSEVGLVVDEYDIAGEHRQVTILADVNLSLPERRVAVIGPNGAGKSTLLRMVNGLVAPTTGVVLADGVDPVRDPRRARRQAGYIFTDPRSQLVMSTPLADVELSLRPRVRRRADRHRLALELLADRGLSDIATRSVHDLSGGERQLVALASVLAVEPTIIIADEPTTLLDLRNREQLRRAFDALDQQILCSTHDLDLASTMDRVLAVENGRIVDDGAPGPVIQRYRERMTMAPAGDGARP